MPKGRDVSENTGDIPAFLCFLSEPSGSVIDQLILAIPAVKLPDF